MALKKLVEYFEKITGKGRRKPKVPEKRQYVRFEYPARCRPTFNVREQALKVVNISERGLKLSNDKQADLGALVHGDILFFNGKSMAITGEIVWARGAEIGMLTAPISESFIVEEIRSVLRKLGLSDPDLDKSS